MRIKRNSPKINSVYYDSLMYVVNEVAIELERGRINEEEARFIIGLAIKKDISDFVKYTIKDLVPKSKTRFSKSILFFDYSNRTLNYE